MAQKCVHQGCGKTYTDEDEVCRYHPGPPIFHEGQKGKSRRGQPHTGNPENAFRTAPEYAGRPLLYISTVALADPSSQ